MSFMDEFKNGGAPGLSAERLNEPFHLSDPYYESANDRIVCPLGRGRAELFSSYSRVIVEKDTAEDYYINTPAASTTYYLYLGPSGFTHNTTGAVPSGAVLLWEVATGSTVDSLTKTDRRAQISSVAARLASHLAESAQAHGDHDSQDILLTRDANGKLTGIDVKKPDDLGVSRITATLSFDANDRLSSVLEKELDTDGVTVKSQATTTILRDANGRITELEVR